MYWLKQCLIGTLICLVVTKITNILQEGIHVLQIIDWGLRIRLLVWRFRDQIPIVSWNILKFFVRIFAVHQANTRTIFSTIFRSPPFKYKDNIFRYFSQSTKQIQGQYFSLFFAVHHSNTRIIFFTIFRSPPRKYKDNIFHYFSQSTIPIQG